MSSVEPRPSDEWIARWSARKPADGSSNSALQNGMSRSLIATSCHSQKRTLGHDRGSTRQTSPIAIASRVACHNTAATIEFKGEPSSFSQIIGLIAVARLISLLLGILHFARDHTQGGHVLRG